MNRSRGIGSRNRSFFGRLSSVLGILLALAGAFFVNNVLTLTLLGIVLGRWGQFWAHAGSGARRSSSRLWCFFSVLRCSAAWSLAWRPQATTIRSQKSTNDARFRT